MRRDFSSQLGRSVSQMLCKCGLPALVCLLGLIQRLLNAWRTQQIIGLGPPCDTRFMSNPAMFKVALICRHR